MAVRNCQECGQVFDSYVGARRCEACLEAEEQALHGVRDFVKANPGVSIAVAVEATGVSEDRIRDFMRSGLLQGTGVDNMGYPCRKCQRPISTGEFCPLCLGSLRESLGNSTRGATPATPRPGEARAAAQRPFVTDYRNNRKY